MTKQEIRMEMHYKRDRYAYGHRDSMKIWDSLERQPLYLQAQMVFAYAAFRSEAETFTIIEETKRRGKTLCLPRMRDEKELDFFEVRGLRYLERNHLGIYEPSSRERLRVPDENTLMLVPGMAFDRFGHRIGMGQGYYDRYLQMFPLATCVGMCFDFQFFEEPLPVDAWDIRMQYVLTPRGLYCVEKGKWL